MATMQRCVIVLTIFARVCRPQPHADVVDSAPRGGFRRTSNRGQCHSPYGVPRAGDEDRFSWWDPEHTFSGSADRLSIDDRPGGCFCEEMPDGGGVRHMVVAWTDQASRLRLEGALGPLQALAVTGTLTWTLAETEGRTRIEAIYTVGGYAPGGLEAFAAPVDGVINLQVQRLKSFIETGRPE